MNILVLGAGGFIGSHLVERLIARDEHDVVGVDVSDDKLEGIAGRRFRFRRLDIRRRMRAVDQLIRECDLVVDLIAYANPSMYVTSPLEVFDLNFTQNLAIARCCIAHRRRLIQFSSAEVYGKASGGPLCHEDATDSVFGPVDKPRWIYATGKLLLERVLHAHGAAGDLTFTIVRPFNFIGPRIDYLVPAFAVGGPRVFPHFMSALLTGGPLRLVNGGEVHRAFLHIDDAMDAFQMLLDHPMETRNQILNIGNPSNNVTVREFALLMLEIYEHLTGHPPASWIENISGDEFYGRGYEDGDRLPPDISKMRAIGWEPRRDLATTLEHTMRYYIGVGQAEPARRSVDASLIAGRALA